MANVAHAKKTSPKTHEITCSGCGKVNDCNCLSDRRLLWLTMPLLSQLVDHLLHRDGFIEEELLTELADLVAQDEQRQREEDALWGSGSVACSDLDRDLLEEMVTPWGYTSTVNRSVEGTARRRKSDVGYVRDLLDRFLLASSGAVAVAADSSRRAA